MKIFDNPNQIPERVIRRRSSDLDLNAKPYAVRNDDKNILVYYVEIDSTLTDADIETLLSTPLTADEQTYISDYTIDRTQLRTEYQNTITQLLSIENAVNPTNAQVIAAVKYLARTVRLLLKLLARLI